MTDSKVAWAVAALELAVAWAVVTWTLTQDKVVVVEWVVAAEWVVAVDTLDRAVTLDKTVAWVVAWVVAVDTTTITVAKAVACRCDMAWELIAAVLP